MLFNSLDYLIFLTLVFFVYWFPFRRCRMQQNLLLLVASYTFYSWWDLRFLALLVFSTVLDYLSGLKIYRAQGPHSKRFWLILSVTANLGVLGFFKYFNFFLDNLRLLDPSASVVNDWALHLVLPVGVSFYTFHGLSYVFDIYNEKIVPTTNLVNYCLFVSFFPLLVAGPIERADHLLPQIETPRTFDPVAAADGLRQILWGLFKKVVVADNCAFYVNKAFSSPASYSSSSLILYAIFFSIQIYGDFSGYSDIALGSARLLGFELLRNFSYPYFSRDIAEFWRRWHISLSSWFRDYLYLPLGGSRGGTLMRVRNTMIIFLVSGFWHGANWTYLFWGGLNGLLFLPLLLSQRNRTNLEIVANHSKAPSLRELGSMLTTFALVTVAWVFFRSATVGASFNYLRLIFDSSSSEEFILPKKEVSAIVVMLTVEWISRRDRHGLERLGLKWPRAARWTFYYSLVLGIYFFAGIEQQFIYFQF